MTTNASCGKFNFITFQGLGAQAGEECAFVNHDAISGRILFNTSSIDELCAEQGECGCLQPTGGKCVIQLCSNVSIANDTLITISTTRAHLGFFLEQTTNSTAPSILQPFGSDECDNIFSESSDDRQEYCSCVDFLGLNGQLPDEDNAFICNDASMACKNSANFAIGGFLKPVGVIDDIGDGNGDDADTGNGNNTGVLIGGIIGAVLLGLLVIGFIRRTKSSEKRKSRNLMENNIPNSSNQFMDLEVKVPIQMQSFQPDTSISPGQMYISNSQDKSAGFTPGRIVPNSTLVKSLPASAASIPKSVANVVVPFNARTPMSRDVLRNSFITYHTSETRSKLSNVLRESFSGRSLANSALFQNLNSKRKPSPRSPNRALPSGEAILSMRSKMTRDEQMQFNKIKSISTKFTNDLDRLTSIFTTSTSKQKNSSDQFILTSDLALKIIHRVCEKLDQETLTADDIALIEKQSGSIGEQFTGGVPSIGIEAYLQRLVLGLNAWFGEEGNENTVDSNTVGIRSLLMSLIYLERIKALEPNFTLTVFSVHRLFATMMLISAKFCEDEYISAEYWGQVAGIEDKEVGYLEEQFAFSSGFNFAVTPSDILTLYKVYGVEEFRLQNRESEMRTTMGTMVTDWSELTESNPMMKTKVKKRKRKGADGLQVPLDPDDS